MMKSLFESVAVGAARIVLGLVWLLAGLCGVAVIIGVPLGLLALITLPSLQVWGWIGIALLVLILCYCCGRDLW